MRNKSSKAWAWVCAIVGVIAMAIANPIPAGSQASEASQVLAIGTPNRSFTFAVIGDNRGEADGSISPIFDRILERLDRQAPSFVINTGDMIAGYSDDETVLRKQWHAYRESLRRVRAPFVHAAGNHDLFNPLSARLWKELWGPTYFSFDHGPARFIVLDTETVENRIDETQFRWLSSQLESGVGRHVFIALHRPLFPVDGHIGASLDAYPVERDRLHALFVRYRDRIGGIFQGHEHLYHSERRDELSYFIIGGAGATLYVPPELGGFYQYLLVDVTPRSVSIELRPMTAGEPSRARSVALPAKLLESWEAGGFWHTWDPTVTRRLTSEPVRDGRQALQVWFDFALYGTPVLYLPAPLPADLQQADGYALDVFVPAGVRGALAITPAVGVGDVRHSAPTTPLEAGWNTVVTYFDSWLPSGERTRMSQLDWVLSSDDPRAAASITLDRFRTVDRPSPLRSGPEGASEPSTRVVVESWEGRSLWGVWDDGVSAEFVADNRTEGARALRLSAAPATRMRAVLYTNPQPAWDLSKIGTLALDVFVPEESARAFSAQLAVVGESGRASAELVTLRPGWNQVEVALDPRWLPPATVPRVTRLEWAIAADRELAAPWVVVDNFRAKAVAP